MNSKNIIIVLWLMFSCQLSALNIHEVNVTQMDNHRIQISLYTEAVELYYFQTWQYSIDQTEITLNVLFMSGFGSKMALLNNNFELYFNEDLMDSYKLTVKVYYDVFDENQLQDSVSGILSFPILNTVSLKNALFEAKDCNCCFEAQKNLEINIFDISNKLIFTTKKFNNYKVLEDLSDGFYLMVLQTENKRCIRKIILKR